MLSVISPYITAALSLIVLILSMLVTIFILKHRIASKEAAYHKQRADELYEQQQSAQKLQEKLAAKQVENRIAIEKAKKADYSGGVHLE